MSTLGKTTCQLGVRIFSNIWAASLRPRSTQPAVGASKVQCLNSAADTQAAEQAPEVNLDRVFTDTDLVGDVTVGEALRQHHD